MPHSATSVSLVYQFHQIFPSFNHPGTPMPLDLVADATHTQMFSFATFAQNSICRLNRGWGRRIIHVSHHSSNRQRAAPHVNSTLRATNSRVISVKIVIGPRTHSDPGVWSVPDHHVNWTLSTFHPPSLWFARPASVFPHVLHSAIWLNLFNFFSSYIWLHFRLLFKTHDMKDVIKVIQCYWVGGLWGWWMDKGIQLFCNLEVFFCNLEVFFAIWRWEQALPDEDLVFSRFNEKSNRQAR